MVFNAKDFFTDFGIEYLETGHKHCRYGWIQTKCPFCTGNPGYHLGYNLTHGFFTCWRCGYHPVVRVVHIFTAFGWEKSKELVAEYSDGFCPPPTLPLKDKNNPIHLKLPRFTRVLKEPHKEYLQKRGFIPEVLQEKWRIKGTGPIGVFKHRIIAPIYFNGALVSYQGRDYTDKSNLRYRACDRRSEIIHHKDILYGIDLAKGSSCILVEGITDAWRLGPGAVATFGIKYTESQFALLWERFDKVFIMFDDDKEAVKRAKKLGAELSTVFNIKAEICLIKGDPGSLPQKKADRYKRQLLGKDAGLN